MKKEKIFVSLFSIYLFLLLAVTGCGKDASQVVGEKMAEQAIESQLGGKVDIDGDKMKIETDQGGMDVDGENIKIKTDQGNYESGAGASLPDNFPKDVYVVDGDIKSAMNDLESDHMAVSIETTKTVKEVSDLYVGKLKSDGWKLTGDMDLGGSRSIMGEKDSRLVSVVISLVDNKTTAVISVNKK